MGYFDTLVTGPRAASPGPHDDFWYGPVAGPTAAGVRVSPDTALAVGAVFACVDLLSDMIATPPLITYERKSDGGRDRAAGHPLYALLHDQPNDWQTSAQWRKFSEACRLLRGNAYSRIVPGPRGFADQLVPLLPQRVTPRRLPEPRQGIPGPIVYDVLDDNGRTFTLPGDEVMHIPGPLSADGFTGLSVVTLARESIALAVATESYGARFFSQNSVPRGAITVQGTLEAEGRKRVRDGWRETYGGLSNSHGVAVLDGGATFQAIGLSNEDSQFLETRRFQTNEISGRWFRVPSHMIGDTEKSTTWGCLPGDTMVFTTHGPVPIADVTVGDTVWSLGRDGIVASRVTAHRMTGIRPVMTVKTIGRTLRLTDNHRVLVRRYQGRADGRRNGETGYVTRWLPAKELRVGDYLAIPHGLPSTEVRTAPNGRVLTVKAMELMGLYLGDGSRDGKRIEISHGADADYMPYYREAITEEFGVTPYSDKRRTRFSSRDAIALLETGFTGDCYTKRVPPWVFSLSRELQLALLRGFVDSDGGIQRGRVVFSSANRLLLEDMRHLCIQVGVPTGRVVLAAKAGPTTFRGRTYQRVAKYHLALSSVPHNGAIGSNSPLKSANLQLSGHRRKLSYDDGWEGDSHPHGSARLPIAGWPYHDLKLQKVRSIAPADGIAIPVYDISVEGGESFIADGVMVHNSGIEHMSLGFILYTMLPRYRDWENVIQRDLIINTSRFYAEFLVDVFLRGDAMTRAQSLQIQRQNGVINADAWAQIENRNPLPNGWGEDYWMPANMTVIGAPAPPPEAAAPAGAALPERGDTSGRAQAITQHFAAQKVRKEVKAISRQAQRNASDPDGWRAFVTEFYDGFTGELVSDLLIPEGQARLYCEAHRDALIKDGVDAMAAWEQVAPPVLAALALG